MSELKEHIETILDETFTLIDNIYLHHREGFAFSPFEESRLVFPRYSLTHKDDTHRNAKTRVSEQELRFAFVEKFNEKCRKECWPYYYSIETPTDKRYVFQKETKPRVANKDEGVSGQFDLVVYSDKGERICYLEFKAGMSPRKAFEKDFLKQTNEVEDHKAYFVHLLDEKANKDTLDLIKQNRITNRMGVIYVCHIVKGKTYSEGSERWESLPNKNK